MRVIYVLILMLLLGFVGVFVLQNSESISLQYLGWSFGSPPWLLIFIVYLAGMVSGWTVVAFMRYSLQRASEQPVR